MTPLVKRLPREFKNNLGKYLGILLLMVAAISLVSGFLVAASSILKIESTVHEDYLVEDGRFSVNFAASNKAIEAVEDLGVAVYENFSFDVPATLPDNTEATLRAYQNRHQIDLAAYVDGRAPETAEEIALDRVFCQNNSLSIGDTIKIGDADYTLCGIMTLSDYQALFERNTDFVFNALTFSVAQVTPSTFEALKAAGYSETFTYSFRFDEPDLTLTERTDYLEKIAQTLADNGCAIADLGLIETNQAYAYPADDAEGDSLMWETLMLILIVIMAFVFAILTSSTIESESAIIGTLLASGYRKREIILHYLTMPFLVGLIACVIGNVIGYAWVIDMMKGLYYNSYSLPPFQVFWDPGVFVITSIVPFALLMAIMLFSLLRIMKATPLQFLRHEAQTKHAKHVFSLPDRWSFIARFRTRIFLRNLSNFVTLFFGIALASMLLLFGFCMMPTVEQYAQGMKDDLVSHHQYTLKAPLEIEGTQAERTAWSAAGNLVDAGGFTIDEDTTQSALVDKLTLAAKALTIDQDGHPVNAVAIDPETAAQTEKFAATSLDYLQSGGGTETITFYGVQDNSRYWQDLDIEEGRIVISRGFADKYGISPGQTVTLHDKYEGKSYEITIDDTYGSMSAIYVYASLATFNELFGNEPDYFNGYVSDEALPLDERYVINDLTPAAMDAITDQMEDSMGDMCSMLVVVSVVIYLILMYLLTKTVIDRSARAISYMKVFGYRDKEIKKLYLRSISIVVGISLVASIPLVIAAIGALLKVVFLEYSGNFLIATPPLSLLAIVLIGAVSYAAVAFVHTRRIMKVPLNIALKIQE